mgnify:CR=1 FL=1
MPKVGFKQFPYTEQGIAEAESYSEATGVPVSDSGIPVSNAQERNVQTYWNGGRVTPQQGLGAIDRGINPSPQLGDANVGMGQLPSPSVPRYNKGGKVKNKGYKK